MINNLPNNFLQTSIWSKFWLEANNPNHKIHILEINSDWQIKLLKTTILSNSLMQECDSQGVETSAKDEKTCPNKTILIYQYPWKFNQIWLYIPRFGVNLKPTSKIDAHQLFQKIIKEVIGIGKIENATLIKLDFDSHFYNLLTFGEVPSLQLSSKLEIDRDEELDNPVNNKAWAIGDSHDSAGKLTLISNQKIVYSPRKINFLSTIVLDVSYISSQDFANNSKPSLEELQLLFVQNIQFWNTTNQNVRRYTKKSIEQNWKVEVNSNSFEDWYGVYQATVKRQSFATHSKEYLQKLYDQEFAKSIILRDEFGIPQTAWLGGIFGNTLIYLHGGNTEESLKKYGQYLIHLVAINIASKNDCTNYDLGGWEEGKGFSKFKKGYRGQIVNYPGNFDVVLKQPDYFLTKSILQLKR